MASHAFSIRDAVRYGWETARKNLKLFAVLVLIGFFLQMLQDAVTRSGQATEGWQAGNNAVAGILGIILQLVQMVVTMGWIRIALEIRDGKPAKLSDLATVFPNFINYLFATILFALIVAGGMILLIVPGFIWMAQFGLYGFVVMDTNADPIAALKRSSELTRGTKGWLLLFAAALIGINILGALALLVGLFVTLPLSALAAAHVYRQLVARSEKRVTAPEAPPRTVPGGTPTPA